MRLRSIKHANLEIEDWTISNGETWCVLGGNASGKSSLAAVICGDHAFEGQILDAPNKAVAVSLESLQRDYERELANDDSDFLDRIDYGSTGLEILLESGASEQDALEIAERFNIQKLLHRGCRQFSSGEIRRVYLLREVLQEPDLLILDEPFEGLDSDGRETCSKLVESLIATGHNILLLVNRIHDIAEWATHLALLQKGKLLLAGTRDSILKTSECRQLLKTHESDQAIPDFLGDERIPPPCPLIQMTDCSVAYDEVYQFRSFDWTLLAGEHTLISGPNGSGKSTLLNLITGDHPQCYTNDLRILGYQRGTGESIWEIKSKLGIVSPAMHRDYRAGGSLLTVVLSGFFDSIGLYEKPLGKQITIANQWLQLFGMSELANSSFRSLSFGQQRLALIARGLVKQPPLLILDEPTQGLDDPNRHLVLAYLEKLAALKSTTLLFVSHREDEHLSLFKKRITFEPDLSGKALFRIATTNS